MVIGIGVVIGFAVVSLSMYMAVLQRTREIGILKSLGRDQLVRDAADPGGGLLLRSGRHHSGHPVQLWTRWAIMHAVVPASLPQAIVPHWWPIAGRIAMGAALLARFIPA